MPGEVRQEVSRRCVMHQSSHRDTHNARLSIASTLIFATPVFTSAGLITVPITKIEQRRQIAVSHEDDISSFAAIAPVRPSLRHEFLTAEAHAAMTTISRSDENFRFIDEH
jgi:hypothetical protein